MVGWGGRAPGGVALEGGCGRVGWEGHLVGWGGRAPGGVEWSGRAPGGVGWEGTWWGGVGGHLVGWGGRAPGGVGWEGHLVFYNAFLSSIRQSSGTCTIVWKVSKIHHHCR